MLAYMYNKLHVSRGTHAYIQKFASVVFIFHAVHNMQLRIINAYDVVVNYIFVPSAQPTRRYILTRLYTFIAI